MASVRRFARAAQFALATTSVWAYVLFPAPVQAVGFEACERPSCASKDDIFRMMREAEGRASSRETQAVGSGASTSAAGDIAPHANKAELKDCDCPPDRAELGFHSWQLLHSVAANFPDHPSEREQEACTNLFSALGELYPCRHCSAHLKHSLETSPPQVQNRKQLSKWVCDLHNKVNSFLDKPQFPCDIGALDERWLTGHKQCWQHKLESAQASMGVVESQADE